MDHKNSGDIRLVRPSPSTHREINSKNRQFWQAQSRLIAEAASNGDDLWEEWIEDNAGSPRPVADEGRDRQSQESDISVDPEATAPRAGSLTPNQYVSTHEVTKELERLGVTEQQLQSMRFRNSNQGVAFDLWVCQWEGDIPNNAISLVKAYCALKWLFLHNPLRSRDKQDAEELISRAIIPSVVAIGERTKQSQSARAQKSRVKIGRNGETMLDVIRKLAAKHPAESALGLWGHFSATLEEENLDPKERVNGEDKRNIAYSYDFGDGRREISFGRFQNVVSKSRKGK